MLHAADPFLKKVLKMDSENSVRKVCSTAVGKVDINTFDRRKIPLLFCYCICYNTGDVWGCIGSDIGRMLLCRDKKTLTNNLVYGNVKRIKRRLFIGRLAFVDGGFWAE